MTAVSLGAVQLAALAAIAASADGLTVAALTTAMGRGETARKSVNQAVRGLAGKGCVHVVRYERRMGNAAAVWGASTTGLAALEAEAARAGAGGRAGENGTAS